MKVHRRWLKLALVTIALMLKPANTQVYTMRSDLGEDSKAGLETDTDVSNTDVSNTEPPTPTVKPLPSPIPDETSETDETPPKAPHTPTLPETENAPRHTTNKPNETPPETRDGELRLRDRETLDWDNLSDAEIEEAIANSGTSPESPVESEESLNETKSGNEKRPGNEENSGNEAKSEKEARPKKEKKSEKETESGNETESDESGSPKKKKLVHAAGDDSELDEAGSLSPKTTKAKKKSLDSTSGSDTAPPSSKPIKQNSTLETTDIEQQEAPPETQDTDAKDDVPTTESSTNSASDAGSSSSAASALADSSLASAVGMSNTVMLGLMMGIAVALGMLVAVFVYVKTREKEDDYENDPVLRTVRQDKGTVQSSTVAADFHEDDMSPMDYDDNYYPNNNHDYQYDQDAYGHHRGDSVNFSDSNFDVLTPRSQIVLAHSQMSLPPMAHSGQSHSSSQYSNFTAHSDFYGNSGYSAASSSASQAYPGMRRKGPNDSGVSEDSDYEGDAIQDMSYAARRNRGGAGEMDRSLDSRYEPSDSRSTSASDYNGKNHFQDSDYTEYRMSNGYDNSFAASKSGYTNSFDASKSDYDKSFAASNSGYDSRYTGGKSFASSGFSEYAAPPRNRGR